MSINVLYELITGYVFKRRQVKNNPPKAANPNVLGSGTAVGENEMSSSSNILTKGVLAGEVKARLTIWPANDDTSPKYVLNPLEVENSKTLRN